MIVCSLGGASIGMATSGLHSAIFSGGMVGSK